MTDVIIAFCNWYFFTVLPIIPENFIDLFILLSFFAAFMLISILACSAGLVVSYGIHRIMR